MSFTLSMLPALSVEINTIDKEMYIDRVNGLPSHYASISNPKRLPFYIEPDFTDHDSYQKWVKKLRLYILFS